MNYYRLYHMLGTTNRIGSFEEFEESDDDVAIALADGRRGLNPMELWSSQRKVKRWDGLHH